MNYNFDKIIDRSGTGTYKYGNLRKFFGRDDLTPLWVADMDFETPPCVVESMRRRLQHPVLGYTMEPEDYRPAITDWIRSHHGWEVKPEWISFIPGVVSGIGMAVNALTSPGDKVIIMPPVYHPFRLVPLANHREVVFSPLKHREDGLYDVDFDNLASVADDKCKLLILSNPHNPGGIVWDRPTLERIASFASENNITVISDEIHCDLTLFGHKHIPFASLSDEAAKISITFGAPTKTFNMAGVLASFAIVPDDALREKFYSWMEASELAGPNLLAPIATIAAFREGEQWRKELIAYIEDNIRFVEKYCAENIPAVKPVRPEASYLVWLDCRQLGLTHEELNDLFINKAHLALNDGEMFGKEGHGYMRLNVACPRSVLEKALSQLRDALNQNS